VKLAKRNVIERGLVVEDVSVNNILENHAKYSETEKTSRRFASTVLAYVTPVSINCDILELFSLCCMFCEAAHCQTNNN